MRMDGRHFEQVSAGFSLKARVYDAFGEGHPALERMRQKVRGHILRRLRPGDRILELNAGTGADALFFAQHGYPVHATDLSPGMVAAIAEKATRPEAGGRLTWQACSFTGLAGLRGGPFQYVYSNFGGLNCVPDLSVVADEIQRVLVPGGRLTWVIMPPVAPWELALLFKGQARMALRRLRRGGVRAHVEGAYFTVHYFSARQAARALGAEFQVLGLEGLGVVTPPADRKDFALRRPRLYRLLAWLDDCLAPLPPFNGWGDFYILSAEYHPK